jgi:hypothetical protein
MSPLIIQYTIALACIPDLLFCAKHLFVAAIGGSSKRHWRQDSSTFQSRRRRPRSDDGRDGHRSGLLSMVRAAPGEPQVWG